MNLGNPIAMGNTAKIYLYENRIIKVFNDFLPDSESLYEANKQKYAYSCGLPVPEIVDVTIINGKQAIIMEYVKGRTFGDLLSDHMDDIEYYINISINIQQQIHMVVADSFELMAVKLSRQIKSAKQLDKRQKSALLKRLDSMTHEKRLCHGDFHLFNLIMTDTNRVTIIDWVDASAGDICADVCRTYLLYTQFSTEIAETYLRLYCKKSGLSRKDILQWAPIIAAARLSENVSSEKSERLLEIVNQYYPR